MGKSEHVRRNKFFFANNNFQCNFYSPNVQLMIGHVKGERFLERGVRFKEVPVWHEIV